MTKAIIIEDEQPNIDLLKKLLEKHCADLVTVEGFATNIRDAITLIKKTDPQLIYLDIELDRGNAFELLDAIGQYNFQIIFISAFTDYAVKAFRYNALDYLLKPISAIELREATEKSINKAGDAVNNNTILEAINRLKGSFGSGKIGVPVADGIVYINPIEIIKVEASGSYCILYLKTGKKITVTKPLKDIEALLPDTSFLRVHNSWIVNIQYLKKYYRGKSNYMEMEDGSTVQVSLRKKRSFLINVLIGNN